MSGHHNIKFNSITDPFSGTSPTLPEDVIDRAIDSARLTELYLERPSIFLSSKGGVNSSSAFLSIG